MEDNSEAISVLNEVYALSEREPQQVSDKINTIRQLKKEKTEIPAELLILSEFVYPFETLHKRGLYEHLLVDDYGLSNATTIKFGQHRIKRIQELFGDAKVLDISCGCGGQLLESCKEGINVAGVEKDPLRCLLAKINVNLAHFHNYISVKPQIVNDDALSPATVKLAAEFEVVLCDSLRISGAYFPELNELRKFYPQKYIVYELRPLENIQHLLQQYPFLSKNAEVEFYGEEDRCSRLTAYIGRGKSIKFFQEDELLNAELSYPPERMESAALQTQQKLSSEFPTHDFFVLNRCLVDNYFVALLNLSICAVDKKRYLCEFSPAKDSKINPLKIFYTVESSTDIKELTAFLQDNFEEYTTALRFEIPSGEYWDFIKENKLVTNRDSVYRFSLFKFNGVYHLAEEKSRLPVD
ncbi:hypothetical protein HZC30_01440 [Candidatus Woesearchaeota archaeon]|nr:hypothetical protein [Candidatus Woesearchaeota archaeon]